MSDDALAGGAAAQEVDSALTGESAEAAEGNVARGDQGTFTATTSDARRQHGASRKRSGLLL